MDSSGNGSVNIVEFVSFMITTKQVQIKLRQQGIIDAEGLNDATRIDHKRRRARLYARSDQDDGKDEAAPSLGQASTHRIGTGSASTTSVSGDGSGSAALLHPQMPVFTGAEYANDGKHSLVENLATCLTHASRRLKLEPMELERWLALQITQLSLADFENASPSLKLRSSVPAYALRHKSSYRGEATGHGRFDPDTDESSVGPNLNDFSFRVTPVGGRKVDSSTQTLLKVESKTQGVLGSEQSGIEYSRSRPNELPLISQGFAQAMQRSQAWQPNHKLVGSEHTLLPLPMLPFAALSNPAHAPAPNPDQFAGSFSNVNASARDQSGLDGVGKQGSSIPEVPSAVGIALGSVHRRERAAASSAHDRRQEESLRPNTGSHNDDAIDDAHAPLLRNNRGSNGGIARRPGAPPRTAASVFGRPPSSNSSSSNSSGGASWGGPPRRSPLAGSREAL